MSTLILCEKFNQAKEVRQVLGDRHGKIAAASGHLLRLQTPNEIDPRWAVPWTAWVPEAMLPGSGVYGYAVAAEDPRRASLYGELAADLARHDTVIVATDPDREGQSIADEILIHAGWKGRALRALYNATDAATVEAAFRNLRDNADFRSQYHSAYARQNIDQIFGFSLTRLVTREFQRLGWAGRLVDGKRSAKIGIGRVRSPIWGLICARETEIAAFVSRDYYEIALAIAGDAGATTLFHRPTPEDRIFDRVTADDLAAAASTWRGPVAVRHEAKARQPPRPADLPTLQKRASSLWGWKASRTLEVLQALYDTHKIVTYPRSETRYLPESMAADAPALLAALKGLVPFDTYPLAAPVIRTGKSGVFSDKALAKSSHHAVIPNVATAAAFGAAVARLSPDETRLFHLIAAFYLAAIGEPYEYDRTEISATVGDVVFKAVGRVVRKLGWQAAFSDTDDEDDEEDGPEGTRFPPFRDGDAAAASAAEVQVKTTQPPPRFTDGGIISEMEAIWKRVEDPVLAAKLKETTGLGTPATRDSFIVELERDGLIETRAKGQLVPTPDGLLLWGHLNECCPPLFDPAFTGQLEIALDDILHERRDYLSVIAEAAQIVQELIDRILAWTRDRKPIFDNPPSAAMVEAARKIAAAAGADLPADVATNYAACRAWLDANASSDPSEGQVKFAQELALRLGEAVPADVLADRRRLTAWLDEAKARDDKRRTAEQKATPASDKQIALIRSAIERSQVPAPKGWPEIDRLTASKLIDKIMKAAPKRRVGRK